MSKAMLTKYIPNLGMHFVDTFLLITHYSFIASPRNRANSPFVGMPTRAPVTVAQSAPVALA